MPSQERIEGAARILEVHAQVIAALNGGEASVRDFIADERQHAAARRALAEWLAGTGAPPWTSEEIVRAFSLVGNAVTSAELQRVGSAGRP
jgi:hypothetical protein